MTSAQAWIKADTAIRELTYLINHIHPQATLPSGLPGAPPPAEDNPRGVMKACSHIATLLTGGTSGIGKTRSQGDDPARQVLAVSTKGATSKNIQVVVTKSLFIPDARTPSNEESRAPETCDHSSESIHIHQIKSSGKSLLLLAHESPRDQISLDTHLADVLAVIEEYRMGPRRFKMHYFRRLIWRRCFSKIISRIRSDDRIFVKPIESVLAGWKPESGELPEPAFLTVHSSLRLDLKLVGIPYQGDKGHRKYEWSRKTAARWIELLVSILTILKGLVPLTESDQGIVLPFYANLSHASYFSTLQYLLRIDVLLSVPSLNSVLTEHWKRNPSNLDNSSTAFSGDVAEDEDLFTGEGESVITQTKQYLRSVVAWSDAIYFLMGNDLLSRTKTPLEVYVIHTPPPPRIAQTHTPRSYLKPVILELIKTRMKMDPHSEEGQQVLKKIEDKIVQKLKWKDIEQPIKFAGTVHSEASMMGLFVAQARGLLQGNVEKVLKEQFMPMKPTNIGTGKKCCWCCGWLAQRLGEVTNSALAFKLEGSHGQVTQWALPTVGIPLEIAEDLVRKLQEVLVRAVDLRFFADLEDSSQTSSPVGSSTGVV